MYPKKMRRTCKNCENRSIVMVANRQQAQETFLCETCKRSENKRQIAISKPPKTELELEVLRKPKKVDREALNREYILALRKQKGVV